MNIDSMAGRIDGPIGMDEIPPEEMDEDAPGAIKPSDDTPAPKNAKVSKGAPPSVEQDAVEEHPALAKVEKMVKELMASEAGAAIRNSARLEAIRLLKMAIYHIAKI